MSGGSGFGKSSGSVYVETGPAVSSGPLSLGSGEGSDTSGGLQLYSGAANSTSGDLGLVTGEARESGPASLGTGVGGASSGGLELFTGASNSTSGDLGLVTGDAPESGLASFGTGTGEASSGRLELFTGASSDGPSGDIQVLVGSGSSGGRVSVAAGEARSAGERGGTLSLVAGAGTSEDADDGGDGGDVLLMGGSASGLHNETDVGGAVYISGGDASLDTVELQRWLSIGWRAKRKKWLFSHEDPAQAPGGDDEETDASSPETLHTPAKAARPKRLLHTPSSVRLHPMRPRRFGTSAFASGTAASAARFMRSSRSSSGPLAPTRDSVVWISR